MRFAIGTNLAMAGLIKHVEDAGNLQNYAWPPEVRSVLREGWVKRESGAVVLAHIAHDFNHHESDYFDLTAYEASVNQIYVPDGGVDLASADAQSVLAARGYNLIQELFSTIEGVADPRLLLAYLSVGIGYGGKPGANIHFHMIHEGERPWGRIDDLEGYAEEAVMVVRAV